MTTQLELEVYRKLVLYLSGAESLAVFRAWFDEATWDQEIWESSLVGSVELGIAEFSSGDRDEEDLKRSLASSVQSVTLELKPLALAGDTKVTTGSENQICITISVSPDSSVGKLREVGCA